MNPLHFPSFRASSRAPGQIVWLLLLGAGLVFVSSSQAQNLDKPLIPFLDQHCVECHDDVTAKGGLDIYGIGTDLSDPAVMERWVRIYDQVSQGVMPPKKKPRPEAGEKSKFLQSLAGSLNAGHEAEKGTVLRRLNRREYENTLNDLFGTHLDLERDLPEDGKSHGFDNLGETLSLSMVQLQRYMEATEKVLDAAISNRIEAPESKVVTARYVDNKGNEKFYENTWLKRPDGATVFFKASGYPDGLLRGSSIRTAGHYKIRINGYAYQSEEPVTFQVNAKTFRRGADKPNLGFFSFPPGKPSTIEFEAWIDDGYMLQIAPEGLYEKEEKVKDVGPEKYSGPGLAIASVEVEGPIFEQYPLRGHELIFEGLGRSEIMPRNPKDREKTYYQPKYEIVHEDETAALRPVLLRVASAAFRRPVSAEQVASYEDLFFREREGGSDFEQALRTTVTAIFCSPDFLYLKEKTGALDDWALASRLSYFLTRSAPDGRLRDLAAKGQLSADPQVLVAEAERLLADARSERFITDFTDAWLDLRNIDFTAPDTKLFPEYDRYLQLSMLDETRAYLRELIEKNHSVASVVKSDFAMLNERLAEHYGIDGVDGPEIRSVKLPADSVRGGFLAQGSVLKVSANGTNTSPIVRGAWVLERMLGVTPPPPPPAVPGVEPDIRGAETLRQLLDKHHNMESCQGCHELIDPPGFALESFNPIGGWREEFRTLSKEGPKPDVQVRGRGVQYRIGLPVDDSGVLNDGRAFDGYLAFREHLAADEKRLARTLVKKMLMFSTGREMGFSDRPEINRIAQQLTNDQAGVRDLLHAVVTSDIFRHK